MKQYLVIVAATLPKNIPEQDARPVLLDRLRRHVQLMKHESMHLWDVDVGDRIVAISPDGTVKEQR